MQCNVMSSSRKRKLDEECTGSSEEVPVKDSSTGTESDTDRKVKIKKEKKKQKKLHKEKEKKKKSKKAKQKKKKKLKEKEKKPEESPEKDTADAKRQLKPMTKEEWEKQQSVIRRVYDEETGRTRLIKGDGEVLEEIVSKSRHKEINRKATLGDGLSFQSRLGILKK